MTQDPKRRRYLEYLARCEMVFHPFAPIDVPEFFAGRREYIRRLQTELAAPGRHVAIIGERGVGKTSLAQLAYHFVGRDEGHTHFVRCTRKSTFDTIFADVLASAGIEVILNGVESETDRDVRAGIYQFGISGAKRVRKTYRRLEPQREVTIRLLLEQLGDEPHLVIIDEFDRVEDVQTHARLAETIKHFSDARAETKFIVVGVADTLSGLIREHESLMRSVAQIRLERMSDDELDEILERAEQTLPVRFVPELRRRIVRLADGFPYFVHLIGRHAALAAAEVLRASPADVPQIAEPQYAQGLHDALQNAEPTLEEQYENAVATTRRPSQRFALILRAMALAEDPVLPVRQIAANMEFFTARRVSPNSLSYALSELVSERRGHVLTRVREGQYRFSNPLMRPYLRSMLELERLLYAGRQMDFPFMHDADARQGTGRGRQRGR